ncbi:MAG TPA: hypothetical protein VIE89_24430 [Candidatus Binatia bacterium]
MAEPKEDLPAEAVTALWEKNKVAAIRIVRQTHHIDLKAAKHKVDQYLSNEPALQQKLASVQVESLQGLIRWLFIIGVLAIAGYYFLVGSR